MAARAVEDVALPPLLPVPAQGELQRAAAAREAQAAAGQRIPGAARSLLGGLAATAAAADLGHGRLTAAARAAAPAGRAGLRRQGGGLGGLEGWRPGRRRLGRGRGSGELPGWRGRRRLLASGWRRGGRGGRLLGWLDDVGACRRAGGQAGECCSAQLSAQLSRPPHHSWAPRKCQAAACTSTCGAERRPAGPATCGEAGAGGGRGRLAAGRLGAAGAALGHLAAGGARHASVLEEVGGALACQHLVLGSRLGVGRLLGHIVDKVLQKPSRYCTQQVLHPVGRQTAGRGCEATGWQHAQHGGRKQTAAPCGSGGRRRQAAAGPSRRWRSRGGRAPCRTRSSPLHKAQCTSVLPGVCGKV